LRLPGTQTCTLKLKRDKGEERFLHARPRAPLRRLTGLQSFARSSQTLPRARGRRECCARASSTSRRPPTWQR
jgi:hypothetical protein